MDNNTGNNQNAEAISPEIKLDVTVRPVEPQNNLLAFASVKINDSFVVEGLRVCTGSKGQFVDMPSKKDSKGEYHDVFFPVTKEARQQLIDAVLTGYDRAIENMEAKIEAAKSVSKPSILNDVNNKQKDVQTQGRKEPQTAKHGKDERS